MWKHPHCFESLLIVLSLTQLASSHNENANNFQIITILCRLFIHYNLLWYQSSYETNDKICWCGNQHHKSRNIHSAIFIATRYFISNTQSYSNIQVLASFRIIQVLSWNCRCTVKGVRKVWCLLVVKVT